MCEEVKNEEKEVTATKNKGEEMWQKVKRGLLQFSEKVSEVVTDAVDMTKVAIKDTVETIKKNVQKPADKANAAFAACSAAFTRADGTTLYAVPDSGNTLIVRASEAPAHLDVLTKDDCRLIVTAETAPVPFDYAFTQDDAEYTVSCCKIGYRAAFSSTLSPAAQVLIGQSFLKLDSLVAAYKPSFFRRSRFAELTEVYASYKADILGGKAENQTAYAALSEQMEKLLPDGASVLSTIHSQMAQ